MLSSVGQVEVVEAVALDDGTVRCRLVLPAGWVSVATSKGDKILVTAAAAAVTTQWPPSAPPCGAPPSLPPARLTD